MASQEERLLILKMIDEGKISADEGTRLLAAVGKAEPDPPGEESQIDADNGAAAAADKVRSIRVRVSDPVSKNEKVNLNVPIRLAEFALRFVPAHVDPRLDKVRRAIQSGQTGRVFIYEEREERLRVEISLE